MRKKFVVPKLVEEASLASLTLFGAVSACPAGQIGTPPNCQFPD